MPDMINTCHTYARMDKYRTTPLDRAQSFLMNMQKEQGLPVVVAVERLVALFKERGGLTAQELPKKIMTLLLHNDDHVGDLSMLPRDVRKYIVQYMLHLHNT
jgi:hypothetical protein